MDHAITVGEVVKVIEILGLLGVLFAVVIGFIWFMGQGWNH